jgi:anthranilate phosphoribosyltransferase
MAVTLEDLGGWKAVLTRLVAGEDLDAEAAGAALREILAGTATPAQIAAYVTALAMKGETVTEVVGMVDAMLAAATRVPLPEGADPVDIVGTGGGPTRRVAALNVSTMASFVAAGAGAVVCKHGNRRASSTSGSFDLLEALGVAVELDGPAVERCLADVGLAFCFARGFHPAMRHAGPVRADLGFPTVFNLLGPLSNPAGVRRQVIGVSDAGVAELVLGVLVERGAPRAMVVHGCDDMDELTLTGPSTVHEIRDGDVRTCTVDPADLGLQVVEPEALRGGTPAENAGIAHRVLGGEHGPVRDIVCLNAAAALVVAGLVDTLEEGLERARASIDEGRANAKLAALVGVTDHLA